MAICAISFEMLSGSALRPYRKRKDAKYKEQNGALPSRIGDDDGDALGHTLALRKHMMLTTTPVTASLHKPSSYNPSRYRWSVRELERMEKGDFHPETRLELIDGELLNMAPIGYFHAGMVSILTHVLTRGVE